MDNFFVTRQEINRMSLASYENRSQHQQNIFGRIRGVPDYYKVDRCGLEYRSCQFLAFEQPFTVPTNNAHQGKKVDLQLENDSERDRPSWDSINWKMSSRRTRAQNWMHHRSIFAHIIYVPGPRFRSSPPPSPMVWSQLVASPLPLLLLLSASQRYIRIDL